ncbi:MAG: hypothetical protein EBR82_49605 [Caulobacteraceae bacterium]|nr:hypothetical protein [Caulobacteraceae bacterium]
MSLAQAYNRDKERGFVPYRKVVPEYKTLVEEAANFEERIKTPRRLSTIEERLEKLELKVGIFEQRLNNDPIKAYLEPLCSRIGQIEAQMGLEKAKSREAIDLPQIIVPHELRVLKGKYGKCNNRKIEVVQKRWALWRAQYEAGVPMNAIARAWGCDHGSICHAKKQGWEPRKQSRHNYPEKRKKR